MKNRLVPIKKLPEIVVTSVISVILLTITLVSATAQIPFTKAAIGLADYLYNPGFNIFIIKPISSMHPMKLIYLALFTSVLLSILGLKLIRRLSLVTVTKAIPLILQLTVILGIVILALSDMTMRVDDVREDLEHFSGKTLAQRNATVFGNLYRFAANAQQSLEGRHVADIESNVNIVEDPHLTRRAILLYHMYPTVSLIDNVKAPTDLTLYYHFPNVDDMIPDHETVVTRMPNNLLVLTTKEPMEK